MVSKQELHDILARVGSRVGRRASDRGWKPPPSPWVPDRLHAAQVLVSLSCYNAQLEPEISLVLASKRFPV